MKDVTIITTKDGSSTLYNEQLNETYHSVNGAATESLHVFIKNGLHRHKGNENEIHILEVGLGTGLNALLTLENIPDRAIIYYTAVEAFPISLNLAVEYYNNFEHKPERLDALEKIISTGHNEFIAIDKNFNFCCLETKLQEMSIAQIKSIYTGTGWPFSGFDIIYYDAFGPGKQPEMWTYETLKIATDLLKNGGFITTYCAQGQFRRNLKSMAMKVEPHKGPPGKREMTIAIKNISS